VPPKHHAGVLEHLFGIVVTENERHDEAIDATSVARKQACKLFPVDLG
jgi:hypothetical protein